MLITAALVVLSFGRGLILYGGDASALKTVILSIIFFWGVMSFPMAGVSKQVRYPIRAMQVLFDFQVFLSKYVFPPVVIGVFIWLTFTTWKHADGEYGLGEFLREQVNNDVPVR